MRVRPAVVVAWTAAGALSLLLLAAPLAVDAATSAVSIAGFAFAPAGITINVGDTVRWTNNEGSAIFHTSTADNGTWDSKVLANGQSFSFTFTVAGTFAYHCAVHPSMRGSVTVVGPATPAPTPPPPPPPTPPPPAPTTAPPTPAPRTAPPATPAPTATAAPTTAAPTTAAPSVAGTPAASPTPSPSAAATATPSASAVAAASPSASASSPPAPTDGVPLVGGAIAIVVLAAGGLAWWIRSKGASPPS